MEDCSKPGTKRPPLLHSYSPPIPPSSHTNPSRSRGEPFPDLTPGHMLPSRIIAPGLAPAFNNLKGPASPFPTPARYTFSSLHIHTEAPTVLKTFKHF